MGSLRSYFEKNKFVLKGIGVVGLVYGIIR